MTQANRGNDDQFPFGQEIAWKPEPEWIEASNLSAFMRKLNIESYDQLLERSVADVAWFWREALDDLEIEFYEDYEQVVDLRDGPEFPKWCTKGKMNIVHNCIDKWLETEVAESPALRWELEEGASGTMTFRQLDQEVCRCAGALSQLGIGRGDTVGLYMPMVPEVIVAFLAIAKVGGVILPLFSGYGAEAISTRLNDAGARALFTADGFFRRGKRVDMKRVADEALESVPTVEKVIVLRRTDTTQVPMSTGRDHWWHDVVPDQPTEAPTAITDAEEVLMIIYTSGTTGRPKGAVHTHCGFPVKAAQDMWHSMDLKRGETMYWMSDMGWMMGPWLVFGTLINGASMMIYDGAPDFPGIDRLWSLVARHRVTHLGLSPVLVRALKPNGTEPIRNHDVSSLRAVGSTGSPWDPESWTWLFKNVLGSSKPILNYSGGTEISGGILCGNFFKPLKPCAFSGPVVGMDADVVDEAGTPVRGAVGELVIRKPWIGMTRGFWNDRERYLQTYWSKHPGLWVHGDFAAIDEDGLWYILGRSDDTIKVAGKRLGPAEVESILNGHPAVAESAAIGVPDELKGETLVAFCVTAPHSVPGDGLRKELVDLVTRALGKPLKPKEIRFTTALPKTRNAKVMRRVIKAAYLGNDPGDVSSLEDPKTIEAIKKAS